jgi:hypothetical protein
MPCSIRNPSHIFAMPILKQRCIADAPWIEHSSKHPLLITKANPFTHSLQSTIRELFEGIEQLHKRRFKGHLL